MTTIRQNLRKIVIARRKLTPEKVAEIRRRHDAGETQRALAREFGIAESTLRGIIGRISWRGER